MTVVGDAGVGKSRLVAEALDGIDARVVRGRCLPYGEGITYWPVVEVVKQLDALPSDEEAAAALRSLLGESDRPTSADEIAWAFRKLLEEQAPLVVCFDDLQWGEETFLDLVESTGLLVDGRAAAAAVHGPAGAARAAPVLARAAAAGAARARRGGRADRALAAGGSAPADRRQGGRQSALHHRDARAGDRRRRASRCRRRCGRCWPRGSTSSSRSERSVLERGAVEGELFHRGAVQALAPDEPGRAATARGTRPARADPPRTTAVSRRGRLPLPPPAHPRRRLRRAPEGRSRRPAPPFRRLARGARRTLVELDELVGYHLEQAARYEAELGRPDAALALRAGDRLLAAGRRSLGRGDERAAAGLLERALTLDAAAPVRRPRRARPRPGALARSGASRRRSPRTRLSRAGAGRRRDRRGSRPRDGRSITASWSLRGSPDELEALLLDARRRLEEAEDHAGLAYVWSALGYGVANMRGRADDWAAASEQAHHHSRLAGRSSPPPTDLGVALVIGSRPADEALEASTACSRRRGRRGCWPAAPGCSPCSTAARRRGRTPWRRTRGSAERRTVGASGCSPRSRPSPATTRTRANVCASSATGSRRRSSSRSSRPTWAASAVHCACSVASTKRSRPPSARDRLKRRSGGPVPDYLWRQVLARVHAHRGELAEAERLAREAVAASELTDSLDDQCHALWDLAEVLAAPGASTRRSRARAGARPLPAEEEPRAGPPSPPTP